MPKGTFPNMYRSLARPHSTLCIQEPPELMSGVKFPFKLNEAVLTTCRSTRGQTASLSCRERLPPPVFLASVKTRRGSSSPPPANYETAGNTGVALLMAIKNFIA